MESRLVLDAAGIPCAVARQSGWWTLTVADRSAEEAEAELTEYQADNRDAVAAVVSKTPVYGGAIAGAIGYVIILISIDVLTHTRYTREAWLDVGQMQAAKVISGEVWRTTTALTLHADSGHLLSNLAFGIVFGTMAGRILGGGVAWLTILAAGSLGNLLNAMARDGDHASIGASTAVFAALGILVAHALRPRESKHEKLMRRWSPLIGGVVLLSLIGIGGERTDVLAHGTGFISGLLIGWCVCRLPESLLRSPNVQWFSGTATVIILLAAWVIAIVW